MNEPTPEMRAFLILYRALYQMVKDGGAETLLRASDGLNALQTVHVVLFGGPMQVVVGEKQNVEG